MGSVTRLQTRARIRNDFLKQSPEEHRELFREHRLKAEHIAAHPELDQRAREHEADDYYDRPKDDSATAAAICFGALIFAAVVGAVAGMIQ